MPEEIRRLEHFSTSIPNKIGKGTRVLGAIRDAGVNVIAVWGYPHAVGRARLEFVPENGPTLLAAAKQAKLYKR
jgi:hypothetical protein